MILFGLQRRRCAIYACCWAIFVTPKSLFKAKLFKPLTADYITLAPSHCFDGSTILRCNPQDAGAGIAASATTFRHIPITPVVTVGKHERILIGTCERDWFGR